MGLRLATVSDLAAVIACADLAFDNRSLRPEGRDDEMLSQILDGMIYLVHFDAQVAGYISLWPGADQIFIDTLAVSPENQGRGIGTLLLAFAESEAARRGLSRLSLFTMSSTSDNQAFYLRRGYCETGRASDDGYVRVFFDKVVESHPSRWC